MRIGLTDMNDADLGFSIEKRDRRQSQEKIELDDFLPLENDDDNKDFGRDDMMNYGSNQGSSNMFSALADNGTMGGMFDTDFAKEVDSDLQNLKNLGEDSGNRNSDLFKDNGAPEFDLDDDDQPRMSFEINDEGEDFER